MISLQFPKDDRAPVPMPRFLRGDEVMTGWGAGVVENLAWRRPKFGEPHWRYAIRLFTGQVVNCGEGGVKPKGGAA